MLLKIDIFVLYGPCVSEDAHVFGQYVVEKQTGVQPDYPCTFKFRILTLPVDSHHHTLRTGLSDGLLNAGDLLSVHRPTNCTANQRWLYMAQKAECADFIPKQDMITTLDIKMVLT